MSYEGDDNTHQNSIEIQNELIIKRLEMIIFLLGKIADLDVSEFITNTFEG